MRHLRADSFSVDTFERTANGFLNVSGIVTRTGVFKYDDGNELRPADEIFNQDSLKSMFAIPVTWEHPPDLLSSQTIPLYQKGLVASEPIIEKIDNERGVVKLSSIVIQDPSLIEEIVNKKISQFSLGYTCDLIEQHGRFDSLDYSRVQKNILYNHLAVVKDARCGEICSIIPKGETMKYKKDCACQLHKKTDGEMPGKDPIKLSLKEDEEKKDEGEEAAPAWTKKMFAQHEKMLQLLEKLAGMEQEEGEEKEDADEAEMSEESEAKRQSEASEEEKEEAAASLKELAYKKKTTDKKKDMDEDADLYDKKDKRKDSVHDTVSSFKFSKEQIKNDAASNFKSYNRDEYMQQLLNRGAK